MHLTSDSDCVRIVCGLLLPFLITSKDYCGTVWVSKITPHVEEVAQCICGTHENGTGSLAHWLSTSPSAP